MPAFGLLLGVAILQQGQAPLLFRSPYADLGNVGLRAPLTPEVRMALLEFDGQTTQGIIELGRQSAPRPVFRARPNIVAISDPFVDAPELLSLKKISDLKGRYLAVFITKRESWPLRENQGMLHWAIRVDNSNFRPNFEYPNGAAYDAFATSWRDLPASELQEVLTAMPTLNVERSISDYLKREERSSALGQKLIAMAETLRPAQRLAVLEKVWRESESKQSQALFFDALRACETDVEADRLNLAQPGLQPLIPAPLKDWLARAEQSTADGIRAAYLREYGGLSKAEACD